MTDIYPTLFGPKTTEKIKPVIIILVVLLNNNPPFSTTCYVFVTVFMSWICQSQIVLSSFNLLLNGNRCYFYRIGNLSGSYIEMKEERKIKIRVMIKFDFVRLIFFF